MLAVPPLRVAVPRLVLPSRNVRVPVGVPLPLTGVTVADKVTEEPKVAVVVEGVMATVVKTGGV